MPLEPRASIIVKTDHFTDIVWTKFPFHKPTLVKECAVPSAHPALHGGGELGFPTDEGDRFREL
jgi:hypothetical protein